MIEVSHCFHFALLDSIVSLYLDVTRSSLSTEIVRTPSHCEKYEEYFASAYIFTQGRCMFALPHLSCAPCDIGSLFSLDLFI